METEPQKNDWYEKVLEKPPLYRKRLTFLLTALLGFLIVTVWLFITSYKIRQIFQGDSSAETNENLLPADPAEIPAALEQNEIFKNSATPTPLLK